MRWLIILFACVIVTVLHNLNAQPIPAPAAAQPASRSWLSGASTTQPIYIPASRPTLERPTLSLQYDASQNLLTVTLVNKGTKPIVVDHDLIIPLYFTFFNDRDVPIRMETADGPDPDQGDLAKRFVTLDPGQSVDRVIDLRAPIRYGCPDRLTPFSMKSR